jgi:adenosylcobinamide-GDP ribazoletransferase
MSMKEEGSVSRQAAVLLEELRAALLFLTRVPPSVIGVQPAPVAPDFTIAARMFPVAGAIIGAAGGIVLIAAWLLGLPPLIAAGLGVAATVVLTGALHEDGLADFADSFGGATREQKLDIMADSRNGTYGALALTFSVLLRIAALAALLPRGPAVAALAMVAGEALSRAALVREWHDLPAARTGGLANEVGPPEYNAMLVAVAGAAGIVILFGLPALGWRSAALASVLAVAAAYGVIRLTANVLGGRTGDTLGACQQVTVTAFLIGASVF